MVYLNVRSEFTKVLGENIGGTLLDIYCSNIFLDQSPKAKEIRAKTKLDLTKPKSFCTAKETVNKMKRQPMKWERILANHVTDQGLISKIYKQLI